MNKLPLACCGFFALAACDAGSNLEDLIPEELHGETSCTSEKFGTSITFNTDNAVIWRGISGASIEVTNAESGTRLHLREGEGWNCLMANGEQAPLFVYE